MDLSIKIGQESSGFAEVSLGFRSKKLACSQRREDDSTFTTETAI